MTTRTAADMSKDWRKRLRVLSARHYFIVLYLVLFCLLFPGISYYFIYKTNTFRDLQIDKTLSARIASLEDKATYLTRLISHNGSQSISEYNFSFLDNVIKETVMSDDDLIGCQVIAKMSPSASTASASLGGGDSEVNRLILSGREIKPELLKFPKDYDATKPLPVVQIKLAPTQDGTAPKLLFIAPIYVGEGYWGTVNTLFSLKNLNKGTQKIAEDWFKQMNQYKISLFTLALILIVLGTVFAILFTRPMLRSLDILRDRVRLVAKGDLTQRVDVETIKIGEIANLSQLFNEMTENLQLSRQQLDEYSHSLKDKVETRTRELSKAQQELMKQAHEAGMAEMAVGVLHNIGNAITPAKVHNMLLEKKLRDSPLRSELVETCNRVSELLQEMDVLSDEEKKRLSTVVTLIPSSIREEYDELLEALRNIATKHTYIEGIINLQMRYAKVDDVDELIEVNRVVLDGIRIMSDTLEKQQIEISTDLQEVPTVRLNETKLLQILVNLIKNSCEAMENSTEGTKTISITTALECAEGRKVRLRIKDSGEGFAAGVKDSIFTFGYSTKDRSSGYGLHSAANYLIANRGTIEAFSPGKGQGAEFTIRLEAEG